MENKLIAEQFRLLGNLMKIKGESIFKTRAYDNAYERLRKYPSPLCDMTSDELLGIDGVGKAISEKVILLCRTGVLPQLEKLKEEIPPGVVEFLKVRGLGPSKIKFLWLEKNVTTIEELRQKCEDKSILEWKGFGEKTRVKLLAEINFFLASKNKMLYANALHLHDQLHDALNKQVQEIVLSGSLRRNMPIVDEITWLVTDPMPAFYQSIKQLGSVSQEGNIYVIRSKDYEIPLKIIVVEKEDLDRVLFETTGGSLIVEKKIKWAGSAEKSFAQADLPYVIPEMRDLNAEEIERETTSVDWIETQDIKGIVHAHTDWSDGRNSLEEMVKGARVKGFDYLTITDHSKAAFYANGLDEKRLEEQGKAIDRLNSELPDFTVLKGIECDILNDGTMDLADDCLAQLDIVIASVHSNLKMGRNQATERLLAAIENPHVNMLGHPSGRLLLSREGYELDYEQIVKACSENKVVIEINANPLRLDIDWQYLRLCKKYNVPVSINPDAHSVSQMDLIKYGVKVARKGGIKKGECINTFDIKQFNQLMH